MADYDPNVRSTNPIACVASWFGDLFRGPVPRYAPTPTPVPAPTPVPVPTVARIRGIEVQRAAVLRADGLVGDDGTGPILELTLLVDDDATAATVLDALHGGASIRVAALGRCG